MSIIDEPSPQRRRTQPKQEPVEIVELEYWVGWMIRPYDGGWKLRRVRMPLHVLEMFTTDEPAPANRRQIVTAQIADEVAHPALTTKTNWGSPIGFSSGPVEDETVDMVDGYTVNQLGMRVPTYRRVPKAGYLKLPEEIRANHPIRGPK